MEKTQSLIIKIIGKEKFERNILLIASLLISLYVFIFFIGFKIVFSFALKTLEKLYENDGFELYLFKLIFNDYFLESVILFTLSIAGIMGFRYFKKNNIYTNMKYQINLFQQSKTILFVLIPIIILLYIIIYIPDIKLLINNLLWPLKITQDYFTLRFILIGFISCPLSFYISCYFNKDFYFYSAKYLLNNSTQNEDNIIQINNLISALYFYNIFLKKTIKFQINDVQKICSKIISDGSINQDVIIKSISNAFDNGKLNPIKYISQFMGSDKFLIKEPKTERLKNYLSIFIPIVTVLVSIISIFF